MKFIKGHKINNGRIPWNKGKKGLQYHTEEWKKQNSLRMKGHKPTEETKAKISTSLKGKKRLDMIGNTFAKGSKPNRTSFRKGTPIEKHPRWLGGISFEPYGLEFNEDLKEVIRNRDRRKCQICEKTELENKGKLHCHHIDYNKKNNNPNNLISLCTSCHIKTNVNRNYWTNYFSKKC